MWSTAAQIQTRCPSKHPLPVWLTASVLGRVAFPYQTDGARSQRTCPRLAKALWTPVTSGMGFPSLSRMRTRYFRVYNSVSISLSQTVDILIQSYFGTCWLQNSSNCGLNLTRKKCFCTWCLLATERSSLPMKQRPTGQSHGWWSTNSSVLTGFSTCHEFQNKSTMS